MSFIPTKFQDCDPFSNFERRIKAIIMMAYKDTIEQRHEFLIAYEKKDFRMLPHVFLENVPQLVLQSYIVVSSWTEFGEECLKFWTTIP